MAGKGRPKRKLIDIMRTQLWVHQLKSLTNSKTFYKLNEKFESLSTNYSSDYANGSSGVNSTTLKLIDIDLEKKYGLKPHSASNFYYIGPALKDEDEYEDEDEVEHVRLWDALAGPIEGLWEILFWYDFATEVQHAIGLSFDTKISLIKARLFNTMQPPAEWLQKDRPNCVAESYINGDITVDLSLLTVVIAVWRLSNFMMDQTEIVDYMMVGLLDKAAEDLLSPLAPKLDADNIPNKEPNKYSDFYRNFQQLLIDIDTPHVAYFNEVIDKANGYCPAHYTRILNEHGSESLEASVGGYEHFRAKAEGTRVSEFLEKIKAKEKN
jgi:hypothetical protein